MKNILISILLFMLGGLLGYHQRAPGDHIVYPGKVEADVLFYNHTSVRAPGMKTSELRPMLKDDFGPCNRPKIIFKHNGDMGICTNAGWKIHQSDQ